MKTVSRLSSGKLKPAQGFAHYFHIGLASFLPAILFVLVRIDFVTLALLLVLLSKWRMFVVRPRYWLINLVSNAVDIIVGLSVVVFMSHAPGAGVQLLIALLYGVWLVVIKPRSSVFFVSFQALISQAVGLAAAYMTWVEAPSLLMVVIAWLVAYLSARHFFTGFEDDFNDFYAYTWAYFSAALVWLLGHWLLFYGVIPQPALLLTVLGFGLGGMYYLQEKDRLTPLVKRQFMFIMFAVVLVVLVFSDWGDKTL